MVNTVQFKLQRIGWAPCHTPGCGQADMILIGRLVKLICQKCGGTWGMTSTYGDTTGTYAEKVA